MTNLQDVVHYDGNVEAYDHFICTICGKIYDLFDNNYTKSLKAIEEKYSFNVYKVSIVYEGVYNNCLIDVEKR